MDASVPPQPDRLLIIEDEASTRLTLRHAFAPYTEVVEADGGAVALEQFRRHRPNFVLTNLLLPKMSGIEVMERARRTFYGACVPFMVLTANEDPDVLADCFRAGADDFMVKPIRISELRIRVSSIHLRQKKIRDVNPLTQLPGNMVLKAEMGLRIKEGREFTILYVDLDHFKPFNDDRGFDAGDDVIRMLSDCLVDLAKSDDHGEVFVGHVGGDDFIALVEDDRAERMAKALFAEFDARKARYYTAEERARGTVEVESRTGGKIQVPLLSMSVGGVRTKRPGVNDVRHISHLAAEVKHAAKLRPGNSLVIDRRRDPVS